MPPLQSPLASYETWRREHTEGWGLAWVLAAGIMERFFVSHGIRATVLKREGMGYYGIQIEAVHCARRREPLRLGRLTAHGDVENWRTGQPGDHGLKLVDRASDGARTDAMLVEAIAHLSLKPLPTTPHAGCHHQRRGSSAVLVFQLAAVLALRHDQRVNVDHRNAPSTRDAIAQTPTPAGVTQIQSKGRRVVLSNEGQVLIPAGQPSLWTRYMGGESLAELVTWAESELGLLEAESRSPADTKDYSADEHQHRYAAWCAARASGRGLRGSTNKAVRAAIEASGLQDLVRTAPEHWPATAEAFDALHAQWCVEILHSLQASGVERATYGRAAKIVAIYLKTRIICGGHASTGFAAVAHPPIDRVLLQALAKDKSFPKHIRAVWRATSWTEIDQDSYFDLVRGLREQGLHEGGFWRAEQWWIGD